MLSKMYIKSENYMKLKDIFFSYLTFLSTSLPLSFFKLPKIIFDTFF